MNYKEISWIFYEITRYKISMKGEVLESFWSHLGQILSNSLVIITGNTRRYLLTNCPGSMYITKIVGFHL